MPPYRSHLQTKVLQSADKICILSFLFTPHPCLCSPPLGCVLQSVFAIWDLQTGPVPLQRPSLSRAAICICNLESADPVPSPAAPLSPACCNLHLQSGICRLTPALQLLFPLRADAELQLGSCNLQSQICRFTPLLHESNDSLSAGCRFLFLFRLHMGSARWHT